MPVEMHSLRKHLVVLFLHSVDSSPLMVASAPMMGPVTAWEVCPLRSAVSGAVSSGHPLREVDFPHPLTVMSSQAFESLFVAVAGAGNRMPSPPELRKVAQSIVSDPVPGLTVGKDPLPPGSARDVPSVQNLAVELLRLMNVRVNVVSGTASIFDEYVLALLQ